MTDTTRYNADWEQLRDVLRLTWREPELAGCRHLDDVMAAIRERPDATLAALLARAQAGDQVAGRIVVQALLGKLVLLASRDPQLGLDDYVAHAWCVLMRYPYGRRSGSVAGGLVLDTLKAACAERRGCAAPQTVFPTDAIRPTITAVDAPARADEISAMLRDAVQLAIIDPSTARIVHAVYVEGLPSDAVGARVALSGSTVRRRCAAAIRRMAAHREDLAA